MRASFRFFLQRTGSEARYRDDRGGGTKDWFLQQQWQFRLSGKLIHPDGIAKTLLYEKDLKVRELTLSVFAKHLIGAWIDGVDYLTAHFLPHLGQ